MIIILFVGLILIAEVLGLLWLKQSVEKYKHFWEKEAKKEGEIVYLALGDSAAQGIGASKPMKGYAGLIAEHIERKSSKSLRVINLSKTGATLKDYLDEQAPIISTLKPDIVTIEIGANDIKRFAPERFRREFKKVLETLPDGAYVSNMPLFNSRPSLIGKAKHASRIIEEELKQYPKLIFVDLEKVTRENQSVFGFAPDLFHPNNLGYKNWSNAFVEKMDI